jgi:hypothetical protein
MGQDIKEELKEEDVTSEDNSHDDSLLQIE